MTDKVANEGQDLASAADPLAAQVRVAGERRLDGQVAVITGGGGVIGAAIARRLAQAGAQVVIADLDADRTEAAALAAGEGAVGRVVDVSSQVDCHAFIEALGQIDVLVCAAGITHVDPLMEVDSDTWRRVFAVNLEGALYCLQAASRIMTAQPIHSATGRRGTVVNIGSQGSEFPLPTSTAYGASKRALIYLTETAAADLAESNIGVSIILPGMVYEGMWKDVNLSRARLQGQDFDVRIDRDLAETPTGRFQRPEDLADIVLFAASSVGLESSGKSIWSEAHVA
jgi:NAD(P)-dependent dehydrogenase (short-subunit alcohol dehydrogenase family)